MAKQDDPRARIPAVGAILAEPSVAGLLEHLAHGTVVGLIREEIAALRAEAGGEARLMSQHPFSAAAVAARVALRAESLLAPSLRPVINATGILIHTNLGRAPLAPSAQEAVARLAGGYANLEVDLETGRRISRLDAVRERLRQVTGAEDALAVNNNAAAVFLVLRALCEGRETIVSRGELVEIGGSFRLPDIMEASGAKLREVGTTNRTRIEDYRAAIGPNTGLILKVHPSNFVIEGFTESVNAGELAALAHERGLPFVEDAGSGALRQHPSAYLRDEPRIQDLLEAGTDLVTASGDKLLGGPQAGIVLGRREWIARLRGDPLARILRLDKLHLAALEATLLEYLRAGEGLARVPFHRMMARSLEELREAGNAVREGLIRAGVPAGCVEIVPSEAAAGGGSLPGQRWPSMAVAVRMADAPVDDLARRLRTGHPPVMGRVERDRLLLDLRALNEDELDILPERVAAEWAACRAAAMGNER